MNIIEIECSGMSLSDRSCRVIKHALEFMVNEIWQDPFKMKDIEVVLYPIRFDTMTQKLVAFGTANKGQQLVNEEFKVQKMVYPFVEIKYNAPERREDIFQGFMQYFQEVQSW